MESIETYAHWKYDMNKRWVYANSNARERTDKIFDKKIIVFKNPQNPDIRNNADCQQSFLYWFIKFRINPVSKEKIKTGGEDKQKKKTPIPRCIEKVTGN